MKVIDQYIQRLGISVPLQVALVVFALVCYGATIYQYPLVDYDEATYAKVVVDTLHSDHLFTQHLGDKEWYDKPPLYFWLTESLVAVLGEHEYVFRIIPVFASALCLWLTYAIVKELTKSEMVAITAFLILLFSPPFFAFAREARLDPGVVAAMLGTLLLYLKGGKDERFLIGIFPAIAIGFLFKSVVIFLIGPILLIYSLLYGEWRWLKSAYLWKGLIAAALIIIPWFAVQSARLGADFWNNFFFFNVYRRAVSTLTGTANSYDYLQTLWEYYRPWIFVCFALPAILAAVAVQAKTKASIFLRPILAPLLSGLLILLLFTLARTHLTPYLMPMFPFLAMFIATTLYYILIHFKDDFHSQLIVAVSLSILFVLIVFGAIKSFGEINDVVRPHHYEEQAVGELYKKFPIDNVPFYALDWSMLETLAYYAGTPVQYLDPITSSGQTMKAPFFMVTNTLAMRHFLTEKGELLPPYTDKIKGAYIGEFLVLLYVEQDIQLPQFLTRYVY